MHSRLASFLVLATATIHAAVGDAWTSRSAVPTSASLQAVVWTGSAFVVAGKYGASFSSADGVSWNAGSTGTQANLNAVASSGSLTVLAGDNGVILTSANGTTWVAQRGPVATDWRAAVWNGSQFVLVGDAGSVATSSDGVTWAYHYIGSMSDLRSVAATASLIVTGGSNGFISVSNDGASWTNVTSGTTATIRSLVTNGSLWAAATDSGALLTSNNANIWTSVSTGTGVALNSVCWTGTQFIVSGVDGACYTSPDGSALTPQTMGTSGELLGGAFGGGNVVVVGEFGIVATSTTGSAWTVNSSGVREDRLDVLKTATLWLSVGALGSVTTSVSGTAWTSATSNVTADLHGVGWNGSKLVAVGDAGTIIHSDDGSAWTTSTAITSRALEAVAGSASQWVAVGESGLMLSSTDGASWSNVTSVTTATWRGITWSGTQFVAVGDSGVIATSANGTAWTGRSSGVTTALESVAWSGSVFVAVGANGVVLTSTTGTTWTKVTPLSGDLTFAHFQNIEWDGVEFVAVGEIGLPIDPIAWVMTSYDGSTWTRRSIEGTPPLLAVGAASGEVFVVGGGGAILQNNAAPLPSLAFQVDASSFPESAGVVQVTLTLSSPSLIPIKIPFATTGSTALIGATGDVIVPASPFTFPANQLTAQMSLTIREDTIDENDETVVLTLSAPTGATLGLPRVHTLTITDNDTKPTIATQPLNRTVNVGTALTMTSGATGDAPLTYQWTKNNVGITGAVAASYLIPAASLTSGGTYQMKATNKSGFATSDPAELVVVDPTSKAFDIVYKNSVTFTIGTSGNNLTYKWRKDGGDVTDDTSTAKRITGSTTKTLVIKTLTTADSGTYRCHIFSPIGETDGGANTLSVIIPPVVNPPMFPTLMVSQSLNQQVTALNGATKFTITGLPSGLTYNSATGLISGRPLIASGALPFTITITASNAAGTSAPPTTMPLTVQPLTGGVGGTYLGLIDREPNFNASLGGRIQLITSKTGVVTGSMLSGKSSYAFLKAFDTSVSANPTLTAAIKRTGKSDLNVNLSLDPGTGVVTGTLQDSTGTAAFNAARNMAAPFTGYPGRYTAALKLSNSADLGLENIPQGYGYSLFTLATNGVASGAIRVADGTQFTFSTSLRNTGALALYMPLYTAPGSLLGTLNLAPGTPALITSTALTWFKPAQLTGRSYKAGFGPLDLTAFGAAYTPPATGTIALGLTSTADNVPNATLNFAEGGAPDPANRLNIQFRLTAPNVRDPQTPTLNPGKVTLSINHLTSGIVGGFSLTDTDTTVTPNKPLIRSALYYALIVRDPADGLLRGFGHFQLPMMPQNAVLPATTPATSPLLSGKFILDHLP